MPILLTFCLLLWDAYSAQNSAGRIGQTLPSSSYLAHCLVTSVILLALEYVQWNLRREDKLGPEVLSSREVVLMEVRPF